MQLTSDVSELGHAGEREDGNVNSVDTVNQTFTAIVTIDHPAGLCIRPSIWPIAVLLEGNVPGSDLSRQASRTFPRVIAVASRRKFDVPVRLGVPWDIPASNPPLTAPPKSVN